MEVFDDGLIGPGFRVPGVDREGLAEGFLGGLVFFAVDEVVGEEKEAGDVVGVPSRIRPYQADLDTSTTLSLRGPQLSPEPKPSTKRASLLIPTSLSRR